LFVHYLYTHFNVFTAIINYNNYQKVIITIVFTSIEWRYRYKMKQKLTGLFGAPVTDRENSMTAGPRGTLLMQDIYFLEQMAHFDREVIPERSMHAKRSGAFGTITVTNDITKYTCASIFAEVGKQTEMFARFSTVAGERGA